MKVTRLGYIFLIIGTFLAISQYVLDRKELVMEKNKIFYTLQKQTGYLKKQVEDTYDMILSIPQINLKKGIYWKEDKRNNIEENVTIHQQSNLPNQDNSNVILMAHSGTGKKAFFNDLIDLNQDSLIEFYYQRVKYVYKIDHYYSEKKIGTLSIKRDTSQKSITLITCSQRDKSKQLVYVGYLIDEIQY